MKSTAELLLRDDIAKEIFSTAFLRRSSTLEQQFTLLLLQDYIFDSANSDERRDMAMTRMFPKYLEKLFKLAGQEPRPKSIQELWSTYFRDPQHESQSYDESRHFLASPRYIALFSSFNKQVEVRYGDVVNVKPYESGDDTKKLDAGKYLRTGKLLTVDRRVVQSSNTHILVSVETISDMNLVNPPQGSLGVFFELCSGAAATNTDLRLTVLGDDNEIVFSTNLVRRRSGMKSGKMDESIMTTLLPKALKAIGDVGQDSVARRFPRESRMLNQVGGLKKLPVNDAYIAIVSTNDEERQNELRAFLHNRSQKATLLVRDRSQ